MKEMLGSAPAPGVPGGVCVPGVGGPAPKVKAPAADAAAGGAGAPKPPNVGADAVGAGPALGEPKTKPPLAAGLCDPLVGAPKLKALPVVPLLLVPLPVWLMFGAAGAGAAPNVKALPPFAGAGAAVVAPNAKPPVDALVAGVMDPLLG